MCERARCQGGETNCFSSTFLGVCAECPPSAASKPHSLNLPLTVWPGGTNSLWTMPWMSKKTINMDLILLRTWCTFFRPWWIWRLPLQRQLLSLRVITVHPCFVTGYDIGDEVGVISGMLFEFPADRNMKGFLVVTQQSWHKSHRNASHVQIVCQSALNGPIWQSYYLTNIVDSLPTICKDSLANFCYVFRCCACWRSSRTLIVVDRWSSVLESVCTIKKFCFGSWHYLWRLPVAFGGFLQQFF